MNTRLRRALSQVRCHLHPRVTIRVSTQAELERAALGTFHANARRRTVLVRDARLKATTFRGRVNWRFHNCFIAGLMNFVSNEPVMITLRNCTLSMEDA